MSIEIKTNFSPVERNIATKQGLKLYCNPKYIGPHCIKKVSIILVANYTIVYRTILSPHPLRIFSREDLRNYSSVETVTRWMNFIDN